MMLYARVILCCNYFITGDCEGAKVASKAVATAAAEAMKQAAAVMNKSECFVLARGSAPLIRMHLLLA